MHRWATLNPLSLKQLNDRIKHLFSTSCKIIFATKQHNFCRDQPQCFETTLKLQSYIAGRNKEKNIVSTLLWYRQGTALFGVIFDGKKKMINTSCCWENMKCVVVAGQLFWRGRIHVLKTRGHSVGLSRCAYAEAYRSWMENYTAVFSLSSVCLHSITL